MKPKPIKISLTILIISSLLFTFGCTDDSINQTTDSIIKISDPDLTIEMRNDQICEYIAVGGEDGAAIKTQAKHFEISEIKRNSETGYAAIYRYKPKADYVGYDFVEIEITPDVIPIDEPITTEIIKIEFSIR